MSSPLLRPGVAFSAAAILIVTGAAGVVAQLPNGLRAHEEARTRMCVLEAVDPPTDGEAQALDDRNAGLSAILETSAFQGVIRGGEALPAEMVGLQQKVERYNRQYAELMTDCRDADRAGVDCAESREMASLREDIRAEAEELLRETAMADGSDRAAAWRAWSVDCADRLLLRPVVDQVCPAGSSAICGADEAWVSAHGTTLTLVDDLETLWEWRAETPWSAFEPLSLDREGRVAGGGTESRVQSGNIIAEVRLGLDLVNIADDPGRADAARAFGAAFDMEFEADGWTVLPVIEFSLEQDAPILGETVYAFFIESENGPVTVLNAEADASRPFAWSTPLRADVAEFLQAGQTLWFTAGGPLPGGGMGPRFTFPFPTEGLQDSILDLAIYLTSDVIAVLSRIATGG